MSNKFFALFAALLFVGSATTAFAGIEISNDGNRGAANTIFTAVYNNSGAALTSGSIVIWDSSASAANLGAYVTTTTSADSNLFAGVTIDASIANTGIGTIVIYGPATARYADSTDGATDTAGQALGTTTVAGQFGNGTGVGCILGAVAPGPADNKLVTIFVNPSNGE